MIDPVSDQSTRGLHRQVEEGSSAVHPPASLVTSLSIDEAVEKAFPIPETKIVYALNYGKSLWGRTAKIIVRLPDGQEKDYFLKAFSLGDLGKCMCEGEFESLKAIRTVSSSFVPEAHAWGRYQDDPETYFLLADFRYIGEQPAGPNRLATRLADLHQRSKSPTGKFGFHLKTCHNKIVQAIDTWEDSWCILYGRHLGHVLEVANKELNWPEFEVVGQLVLKKVVPRLLLPLQSDGRFLDPCLLHGHCWDGNTATDMKTGEPFVFDACSFYGHNEYDTGNWRAARHRVSNKAYMKAYKRKFPVSEPEEDWDARNLLYSLTLNIANTLFIPGSEKPKVVYDDMTSLCEMFCADDLKRALKSLASDDDQEEGEEEPEVEENEEEEEEDEEQS